MCPVCGGAYADPDTLRRNTPGIELPHGSKSGTPPTAEGIGLSEARRVAEYWQKRHPDYHPQSTPEADTQPPAAFQKYGRPVSTFQQSGGTRDPSQLGQHVCVGALLASICTAAYFLGVEEMREDYSYVGLLAVPVGLGAVIGLAFQPRPAATAAGQTAFIYEHGFALVHSGERRYWRWSEIAEVELQPDTRNVGESILYGHKFIVKPVTGSPRVFGVEFDHWAEFGLALMERAAAHGAKCTGRCRLPA